MPFGSVFGDFPYIEFTTADEKYVYMKNSFTTRIGLKFLGLPHIGLRLRSREIMKNIPKKIDKMLDAGCGTGIYSFSLRKKVNKIHAIDIDNKKIKYVNNVNRFSNISFNQGDLRKLKFKDKTFDLIICSDVIEHIKEDKKAFNELARVLKINGLMKITVPYNSKSNKKDYKKYGHERAGYNLESMKILCDENKLKIKKVNYYSYPLTELFSSLNYKIVDNKIALGLLFYPLYILSIISDKLSIGEPNGISFLIVKEN